METIISTQSFSQVILDRLSGNLLFFVNVFLHWQVSQFMTSFWTYVVIMIQKKVGKLFHTFYTVYDGGDTYGTIKLNIYGVYVESLSHYCMLKVG